MASAPLGFAPPRSPRARRRQQHDCFRSEIPARPFPGGASTSLHASNNLGTYLETLPPFLPSKQVEGAFVLAAFTGVFLTFTRMLMRRLVSSSSSIPPHNSTKKQQRLIDRRSLQATYLLANGLFAASGTIALISLFQSGTWQSGTTALSRAQGHVALGAFDSTQAGYSFWSIITDPDHSKLRIDRLDEGTLMLIHHGLIVIMGMLCATNTLGFRVYAPFFSGISEFSSIPLVIMKSLAKGRKKGYVTSRLGFAISFLSVRVVAWAVFMRLYLRDLLQLLASLSSPIRMKSAMMIPVGATVPLLVLTLLQMNWAYVIFANVTRMARNNDNGGE